MRKPLLIGGLSLLVTLAGLFLLPPQNAAAGSCPPQPSGVKGAKCTLVSEGTNEWGVVTCTYTCTPITET
jgi:hypothetical protein